MEAVNANTRICKRELRELIAALTHERERESSIVTHARAFARTVRDRDLRAMVRRGRTQHVLALARAGFCDSVLFLRTAVDRDNAELLHETLRVMRYTSLGCCGGGFMRLLRYTLRRASVPCMRVLVRFSNTRWRQMHYIRHDVFNLMYVQHHARVNVPLHVAVPLYLELCELLGSHEVLEALCDRDVCGAFTRDVVRGVLDALQARDAEVYRMVVAETLGEALTQGCIGMVCMLASRVSPDTMPRALRTFNILNVLESHRFACVLSTTEVRQAFPLGVGFYEGLWVCAVREGSRRVREYVETLYECVRVAELPEVQLRVRRYYPPHNTLLAIAELACATRRDEHECDAKLVAAGEQLRASAQRIMDYDGDNVATASPDDEEPAVIVG